MQRPDVVIVANAPFSWSRELAEIAEQGEPLVAADGGANALAKIGLRPQWVVGDLDSISEGCRTWLGEDVIVERLDQDFTDLDKTLRFVLDEKSYDGAIVLGALGGRIDHAIGNLGLLAARSLGMRLQFREQDAIAVAVTGEAELEAQSGETWSFFSFDPEVRITLAGVRWPLDSARVDVADRPSVSNVATEDFVRIRAVGGPVVVVRYLV